jgi:hypothetical protein
VDDAKWERWAGLGGILFVILVLVSAFLPGNPPMQTDSTAKIARYFNQHRDDIRWASYIGAVAAVPFLWWLGSVWARLRRSEGATPRLAVVAVAGAIFGAVMATAASLVLSTVAIRGVAASPGGNGGAKFWYTLSNMFGFGTAFGAAVFVGAVSAVILRKGAFPQWLGWVGALLALAWVVAGVNVASERKALWTYGFVVFLVFLAWVIVVSYFIFTSKDTGAPSTIGAPMERAASTA